MNVYLDSSAYMRLFLDESGGDDVRDAWTIADHSMTSRLTFVEVRAGLSRARRDGRLSTDRYDLALAAFLDTWADIDVFELDAALGARAGELAETYGLRAGDAVQLAAAIEAEDVTLVAFDRRLRSAAVAAGLSVYPETV